MLWLLISLLSLAKLANAQPPLSLNEALRMGTTNNADLQTAIQREEIAQTNRLFGVPQRLPSLDLRLSQDNFVNQYNSPTNFVRGIYQDNSLGGGISGSWLLYNGGGVTMGQTRLNQLNQRASLETQAVRQQVSQAIIAAYYRVVVEIAKRAVRAEGVALSKARWVDFGQQERLGKVSLFDVLQAENLFLTDSTTYLKQEIDVQIAQNQLHTAIGWNQFGPVFLTDSLTLDPQPPAFSNMPGKLLSLNFTLRSQRMGVLIATNAVQLQRTALAPVIRLNSALYQSFTGTKFSDLPRIDGNSTSLLLAGFSVVLPLFQRETRRAIRQTELEQKLSQTAIKKTERQYLAEADRLSRSYQIQARIVALSDLLVSNTARSLAIARQRLQSNFSSLLEYRSTQLAYTEAKLNRLQALYELRLIDTSAKQLIGTLN